jgi:hypothetical protein
MPQHLATVNNMGSGRAHKPFKPITGAANVMQEKGKHARWRDDFGQLVTQANKPG